MMMNGYFTLNSVFAPVCLELSWLSELGYTVALVVNDGGL